MERQSEKMPPGVGRPVSGVPVVVLTQLRSPDQDEESIPFLPQRPCFPWFLSAFDPRYSFDFFPSSSLACPSDVIAPPREFTFGSHLHHLQSPPPRRHGQGPAPW